MKTFGEAVQLVLLAVRSSEATEAVVDELTAAVCATWERYDEFAQECKQNSHSRALIQSYSAGALQGHFDVYSAVYSAFVAGLIVGIEMEKQDPETIKEQPL